MSDSQLDISAIDEAATVAVGVDLAAALEPGLTIHLKGELGSGKTTLARGLIQALGHAGAVKSPTYTLVEPYPFDRFTVYHFDLYRLEDPEELEFMGVRDYFGPDSVCLIEWPERGAGILPPADLVITIGAEGSGRCIGLAANTTLGTELLRRLPRRAG